MVLLIIYIKLIQSNISVTADFCPNEDAVNAYALRHHPIRFSHANPEYKSFSHHRTYTIFLRRSLPLTQPKKKKRSLPPILLWDPRSLQDNDPTVADNDLLKLMYV